MSTLENMNSFECMWVDDETKSEVILSSDLVFSDSSSDPIAALVAPTIERDIGPVYEIQGLNHKLSEAKHEKKAKEGEVRRKLDAVMKTALPETNDAIMSVNIDSKPSDYVLHSNSSSGDNLNVSNDVCNTSAVTTDNNYNDVDTELTWRLHPSVSLSDWTIEVVTKQFGKITSYPVHKSMLAVGPRRSNYFAKEYNNRRIAKEKAAASEKARLMLHAEGGSSPDKMNNNDKNRNKSRAESPFSRLAAGCSLIGIPLDPSHETKNDSAAQAPSSPPKVERRKIYHASTNHSLEPGSLFTSSSPMSMSTPRECATTDDGKSRNEENVTRFELEELAADAFPYALDYMYSSIGFVEIRTEHATALHYLSKLLEIKSLQYKVEQFWKADLTMETLSTYYNHARLFNDGNIITAGELLCAQNLFNLNDEEVISILSTVDAPFMYNVVTIVAKEAQARYNVHDDANDDLNGNYLHKFYLQLSLLVAVYCNIHKRGLTPKMLWKLTDERHLPVLEAKAAKSLLETQDAIVGPNYDLTSLTTRCVAVLSDHWDESLSCLFGKMSLSVPDLEEKEEDSLNPDGRERSLSRSATTNDSKSYMVDIPKLCGDAMEEFVSLALQNAKDQISQLENANLQLQSRNEALELELERLRCLAEQEDRGGQP